MNQIDRLLTIMQRLRDPENGCPWDKEQTFATIAPYPLEATYEVLEAIELAKQQGKGAIALRGKMIDAPIVNRAKQTIAAAEALGIRKEDLAV